MPGLEKPHHRITNQGSLPLIAWADVVGQWREFFSPAPSLLHSRPYHSNSIVHNPASHTKKDVLLHNPHGCSRPLLSADPRHCRSDAPVGQLESPVPGRQVDLDDFQVV